MRDKFKKLKKDLRRDRQLYLFLLLPLLYIFIFHYMPMGGLVMAFQDYSARKGLLGSEWVGLKHFMDFFNSYQCTRIIRNTLVLSLYSIIAGFPIPICFALLLNSIRNERFKKVAQTIATMPYFISVTVLVGIIFQLFNSRSGFYGQLGMLLNSEYPVDLFGSPSNFRHMYVWSDVWQSFGWNSVIYIAALSAVDPEYHDAARIDGATRFQRIIHIDWPCILPTVVITLVLRMGSVMSLGFEKAFLMQNGLNMEASSIISTYVYEVGLAADGISNISYATAIGLFNSVINMILVVAANWIARKFSDTSLW